MLEMMMAGEKGEEAVAFEHEHGACMHSEAKHYACLILLC